MQDEDFVEQVDSDTISSCDEAPSLDVYDKKFKT
jgi:hypothetical protein